MRGCLEDLEEMIIEVFFNMVKGAIESLLGHTAEIFEKSIDNVQSGIIETPEQFSPNLVETLRTISETAVMPIAGLILTYAFCYEIYNLVVEKTEEMNLIQDRCFF